MLADVQVTARNWLPSLLPVPPGLGVATCDQDLPFHRSACVAFPLFPPPYCPTAQQLVAKAPVGKDRAALEAIKADVRGLNASLTEVAAALEAGDYKAAQSKAKAIQDKSHSVSAEIQSALAKTGAAKGQKSALAKKK